MPATCPWRRGDAAATALGHAERRGQLRAWCCWPRADPEARAGFLEGLDPATATRLRRRLADVRRRGVAIFDRPRPAPVSSVAAPVWDRTGRTIAAVSVVVPAGDARPQAYEQVVRATGLAISREMGQRRSR
ncbi:hypothetical protein LWC33_17570 [Pseudonocardia sp. RS11V-5]|uniref:IclR family transcriptional regulator domain-containing protein n=1 Tax=Pseudonocardia terrae TaxID=2905831 RepID=UPI001E5C7D56|nr:IclR family transcriptional regulator C-terminal domain-containing protein [Pseudonocardia terrae]MCE3553260.1 hypothetical protein [Pseudonocardia terrae]